MTSEEIKKLIADAYMHGVQHGNNGVIPANSDLQEEADDYLCRGEIMAALHSVEAEKEPEWLDIDSAPKDRHILGCQSRHGIMRVVRGAIDEFGNWSTGPSAMDFLAEVTHWMELPAPPEHKPE